MNLRFPGLDTVNKYQLYPEDPYIILGAAIGFFIIRRLLFTFVFRPVAEFLQVPKIAEKKGHKTTRYQKFLENAWYSFYYPIATLSMYYVLKDKEWLYDYNYTLIGIPHFEAVKDLNFLYLLQFGYYIQLLINLVFIDEKLDDFYEMLTHHIVTLIMVSLSYLTLWHRAGSIIFFIHDIADVILYWAKMLHNAQMEKISSILFPIFIIFFFLTRILYLPMYLITVFGSDYAKLNPNFYKFSPNQGTSITFDGICISGHCISPFWFITYNLCLLLCLHLYWFYRIILLLGDTLKNSGIVPGDPRYKQDQDQKKK